MNETCKDISYETHFVAKKSIHAEKNEPWQWNWYVNSIWLGEEMILNSEQNIFYYSVRHQCTPTSILPRGEQPIK